MTSQYQFADKIVPMHASDSYLRCQRVALPTMKRAPHVTSCIRGNLGTREPLDAWRRESSLSSAETEPRFWTATRTSRGGTGIMYSRCRQFTLVLYDNEACSLSKVPQSVTFVLIKYFIFRYEVAHVVWVSSNG